MNNLMSLCYWLLNIACVMLLLPQNAPLSAQDADVTRILFLGPRRPVIIEANFVAGPFSIENARQRYAAELFAYLDRDADDVLTDKEAREIPADGRLRAESPRIGSDWTNLDVAPTDEKISLSELTSFVQSVLGPSLTIETAPPKLSATVRIYEDLDINQDGKISVDEIAKGHQTLQVFDFDDDETLSVAELQPFPLSVVQAQEQLRQEEAPRPLSFIRTAEEIENAVLLILNYYDATDSIASTTLTDLSDREFSRFDLNRNSHWDADDLALYLRRSPADFVMRISLSPPQVELIAGKSTGEERPTIDIGGLPVKWVARSRTYQQFDSTRLYLIRFLTSDTDKNSYLDPMEFAGLQANVSFDTVDLDGNQQVTRAEIKSFFEMDSLAAQSRLVLTLANDTTTLFEILDANMDRRLEVREFLDGSQRFLVHDRNDDRALAPEELNTRFTVTISQPQLFETDPTRAQNAMTTQRQGVIRPISSGPLWFIRMDDNLDGDVSWREFLGPRERFDLLDQNRDNFIDRSEADAAEQFRTSSISIP